MEIFFGGSFDPVHVGHLIVARDVIEVMGFEKLIFLPTHQAPLKEPHRASPEDRLRMLELAIEDYPFFGVSDLEIRRGGVSYTVDTARELHAQKNSKIFFLVGADSFLSLHLWKEPSELLSLASFVVVDRDGLYGRVREYVREKFPRLREGRDFFLLTMRRVDVSSTEVRNRIAEGKGISWMVPDRVQTYILQKGLYKSLEVHHGMPIISKSGNSNPSQ